MSSVHDFKSNDPIAWCPGCGDFGILNALKKALVILGKAPKDILMVSGIGQAAKLPHYIHCNCFNGLHGRALPIAVAAKIVNPGLTVIVTTGDGDCYGEGGNHFMHNIRRNADITVIVHNNQIYGLTKGQASPTTDQGHKTKVQTDGVVLKPFHPLETAIALGAGFIARGFSGNIEHLTGLIVEGVRHNGFSLIDVLQPCVTFNKINTYEWYTKRVYDLNNDTQYSKRDRASALSKSAEWGERIPLGILYQVEEDTYEKKRGLDQRKPLVDEPIENVDITQVYKDFL